MREQSYSYRPNPRFFGGGPVYFGLELEVEAPDNERKTAGLNIERDPSWCYAKHDSSLGTYGWEMVTHPIAMNFWMTRGDVGTYRDYHNLTPGQVLTGRYKGTTYTATVCEDGKKVEWNGTVYSSISAAAKAIRGGKATNGYDFFKLTTTGTTNPVGSFFNLVRQLAQLGYGSHDGGRCGFHVHISRTAFSENGSLTNSMFYRFKCLINGQLFRKLSQRSDFRYCMQVPVNRYCCTTNASRYEAVNVTSRTVEVRIFRGNLRETRLRKNLEAIIAALEYAKEGGVVENNPDTYHEPNDDAFITWVRERADRFPNLVEYIADFIHPTNS